MVSDVGPTTAARLILGDSLSVLRTLPANLVQCVVTSPPYWSLRTYEGTPGSLWGNCAGGSERHCLGRCPNGICDAWQGVLGSEPTPEMFVEHLVEIFRLVRRVLRPDGTLWLNLGPTWDSSGGAGGDYAEGGLRGGQPKYRQDTNSSKQKSNKGQVEGPNRRIKHPVFKPKDMVPIPWMVGLALQRDGWWLRSEIIWDKPAPFPESVADRPVKAHEQILLLTKSAHYYYDAEAVREAGPERAWAGSTFDGERDKAIHPNVGSKSRTERTGHNARSVWRIMPEPTQNGHFAKFPSGLPRRCILAGTSEKGCCPQCGAPWTRQVKKSGGMTGKQWHDHNEDDIRGQRMNMAGKNGTFKFETVGWLPGCDHNLSPVGCTVLDPFAGTGTTLAVAQALARQAVGIEISPDYIKLARKRLAKVPMAFAGT